MMIRRTKNLILAFGAALALLATAAIAPDGDVVPDGLVIVLPEQPSWNERYAAGELKHHLAKATGRKVAVVRENRPVAGGRRFYVGAVKALAAVGVDPSAFALEESLVKGAGGAVYLVGGEARTFGPPTEEHCGKLGNAGGGTLYAVYDYLERYLGVKWIWPGELGEVVPKRTALPDLDGVERRALEPLVKRRLRGDAQISTRVAGQNRLYGFRDAANAHREVKARRQWLTRMRCGLKHDFQFGHAFTDWHRRFPDRPELFAKQPCGAVFFGNPTNYVNRYYPLCVANPEVSDIVVADWRRGLKKLEKGRRAPYVNCCENDSPGMCACAKCRAWDADDEGFRLSPYWNGTMKEPLRQATRFMAGSPPSPSLSDRYVRFSNVVLEKARRIRADAEVCAYAYSNWVRPPRVTRVADGVNIAFVPAIGYPYGKAQSDAFRERWGGWNAMGAEKMCYRPNYLHGHVNIPFSNARYMADDINFARAHGLITIDQDSLIGAWSAQALDNYVAARLLHEPDAPYDRLLADYLSAFGAAAEGVRRYVRLLCEQGDRFSAEEWKAMGERNRQVGGKFPGGGWRNWFLNVADAYTEEWFARCAEALDGAARCVSGVELERVRFLQKGLTDGLLTYRTRIAQKSGDAAAFKAAFRTLRDYRASVEADLVCGYLHVADRECKFAGWPHPCIPYYSDRKEKSGPEDNYLFDAL